MLKIKQPKTSITGKAAVNNTNDLKIQRKKKKVTSKGFGIPAGGFSPSTGA